MKSRITRHVISFGRVLPETILMANICSCDDFLKQVIDDQNKILLPATVKSIMDSWTHQSGFPVITLNVSTGAVKQEPFYLGKVKNETLLTHK